MQRVLGTEFGGMNAVLTDLYQQTGDARWLTAAQRFDHAAVFDPLAARPGPAQRAARQHPGARSGSARPASTRRPAPPVTATSPPTRGTSRVGAHTYVIGGNSQAEHFRAPNAIAAYLNTDTAEACNTYNMLKLTRELWLLDPTGCPTSTTTNGRCSTT